jgi:type IV secretory pathway VirD2 relaxase
MIIQKQQKMVHTKAYHDQIDQAEKQILEAEDNMKKMTQQVSSFQSEINASLGQMMSQFNAGVKTLQKAKSEDAEVI